MIRLGSMVRDKVTGLTGICVGRHEWLHGCTRWSIQPAELKDGRPIDPVSLDEPQLELLEEFTAASPEQPAKNEPNPKPGGPRDEPRRHSSVTR